MRTNELDNANTAGPTAPYLAGPLREVTGSTIRPGGLLLTERGVHFCAFPAGARVLDVGCGVGGTVEYLVNRHRLVACGVDHSAEMVAQGVRRNPHLTLHVAATEALPFEECTQDGVFCECVLSLVEEPLLALREMYRVLVPGGCLVLTDLYSRGDRRSREDSRGVMSRQEIECPLEEAGFSLCLWEDHTVLLKELAARVILAGVALSAWCACLDGCAERPGYYLLVAQKLG